MIVYIWCTLTLKSVGFQRNTHVIDGNTETISISNTLRKRKYANWKAKRRIWDAPNLGIGGQPKFLLIDIKYDLFSFSSLVMTQEKPLLVSLPNVLFHLDACLLPTDDPSPAAAGPAAASKHCWSRPPTDPRALLPGSQGTLTHLVPLSVYTGKGNLYPAACGRWLQNAQTLLHRGAEGGKRHTVYNARTLLPGEDTAYSNYDFHYLSYNVDIDTIISSNLQTMASHVWSSEGSFTNNEPKCVVTCCPSPGVGPTRFQTSCTIEIGQAGLRTHCSDPWGGDDCLLNYRGDCRGTKTFNHLFKVTQLRVCSYDHNPRFSEPEVNTLHTIAPNLTIRIIQEDITRTDEETLSNSRCSLFSKFPESKEKTGFENNLTNLKVSHLHQNFLGCVLPTLISGNHPRSPNSEYMREEPKSWIENVDKAFLVYIYIFFFTQWELVVYIMYPCIYI